MSLQEPNSIIYDDISLHEPEAPDSHENKLEVTDAARIVVDLATFFTDKSTYLTPTMIMSLNTIPLDQLEDWQKLTVALKEVDSQSRVLPGIVASMRSKMIELLSKPPVTSGKEIRTLLMERQRIIETQRTSFVITSEMCQFTGKCLALIAMGRLPDYSLSLIIESDSPEANEDQLIDILNTIYSANLVDGYEISLDLITKGLLPETVKRFQDGATHYTEVAGPDSFNMTCHFLSEARKKYSATTPNPTAWSEYLNRINKVVLDARIANNGKTLILDDESKQELNLKEAYSYLLANYIYGMEKKLVK